jgi:hypothetical protein
LKKLSIIARGRNFDKFLEQTDNENWAVCSTFLKSQYITDKIDKYVQVHSQEHCIKCREFCGCECMSLPSDKIIIKHDFDEHPDSQKIFGEELKEMFGTVFYNSIAWMLGYAIYKGYKDITIHGVDMLQKVEYIHQRDGVFFLKGFAKAYGVKINIPAHSGINIYNKPQYGE